MGDESKERWRHSATELGAFALRRMEAEDIHEYMDVIQNESPLMASVLLAENDEGRDDYQQREEFNEWLYLMVRTMYVIDTCADFVKTTMKTV